MTFFDVVETMPYFIGAFGFGWVLGHKILTVKRFAELSS